MTFEPSHRTRAARPTTLMLRRAPAPPPLVAAKAADAGSQPLGPDELEPPAAVPFSLRFWEDVPSWLSSGVFHLVLMLLLSLLVVKSPPGPIGLEVELGRGSGSPDAGELDAAATASFDSLEATAPLDLATPLVEAPPALELATANLSQADLSELGGGGSEGNGDGSGSGDGFSGEGEGYGLSPTKTQMFGLAEEAQSFVYVFDRSESMNSVLTYSSEGQTVFSITPLQAAKAELVRSLEDLDPRQRFQIILYNHTTLPFLQDSFSVSLLPGTERNLQRASDFVRKQPGEGGTYHLEPLEMALKLRPEVIYLMTDGEAKDDPTSAELKQLKNLNRKRTRINVVHFCFQPRPESTLSQLAKDNRGKFLSIEISRLGPGLGDQPGAPPQLSVVPMAPAGTVDIP